MNTYDVDYFIDKFERIPEELWLVGDFKNGNRFCAVGLCGENWGIITQESQALRRVLNTESVASLNDGKDPRYQQPTPKQRILAALRDIKAKQQPEQPKEPEPAPEPKIVYRTVVIDKAVESLQKSLAEN